MPKSRVGPFLELVTLDTSRVIRAFTDGADQDDIDALLVCMDTVKECLESVGCQCNGHSVNNERDPSWGGDISELIGRIVHHSISVMGSDGIREDVIVSVKIGTLEAEIDSNHEVCAWIYEES